MEWLVMFIPFTVVFILAVLYKNNVVWWEYLLIVFPSILIILLMETIFFHSITGAKEYLGYYVNRVEFHERWNEYIHRTCYKTISCGKDCTTSVSYDCSYVDNHPEKYIWIDNGSNYHSVSKAEYHRLVKQFGTPVKFKDMKRNYHSIDGDIYFCEFDSNLDKLEPVVVSQNYINKVKGAKNLFNIDEINKGDIELYGLKDYPIVKNLKQSPVIGKDLSADEIHKLYILNSIYGKKHQIKIFIIYFQDVSMEVAFKQRSYLIGGNKNEFIIMVSEDSKTSKLQWVKCFSWMDKPVLEKKFESHMNGDDVFDINKAYDYLYRNIPTMWKRKDFKDFDYIQIHLTQSQIIIILIIVTIFTGGISYWIIVNEFDHSEGHYLKRKDFNNYRIR